MTAHLNVPVMMLLAVLAIGCAGTETSGGLLDQPALPDFESFANQKADTGYVGSKAAEVEATFTGFVHVELPDLTVEEIEEIAAQLPTKPHDYEFRHITAHVTEQMKYARNMLKAEQLDLNLEGGHPQFTRVLVTATGLDLEYSITVESLVKFKALEEMNLTAHDLVGKVIEPVLPLRPEGLYERTLTSCSTDPDTGEEVRELSASNLFYYFDPMRESCPLDEAELVTGRYEVISSLDAPTVYPEYDLLIADRRIDMVAIFGQIVHGELKPDDNGWWAFHNTTWTYESLGFEKVEDLPDGLGHRLELVDQGLTFSITMYNPTGFADAVAGPPTEPGAEARSSHAALSKARFRAAMKANELVYYNGHAFYGSLKVLDEKGAYPEDTYQVVFMDACWSYAYYTKQVFRNKATEADPEGWALVDVVNNTEPGVTGSEATATLMWQILFAGALAAHSGRDVTPYSWNTMIEYMNIHAENRAKNRPDFPDPEIYGVSGVKTNAFRP